MLVMRDKVNRLHNFWVLDHKQDPQPQWKYWVVYASDVAPPSYSSEMFWRKPTVADAELRQLHFERDPQKFAEEMEEVIRFTTHLRRAWLKEASSWT